MAKGITICLQKLSGGVRDRQLGYGVFVLQLLDKPEMLHEGVAVHAYLAGEVGVVPHGVFPVEGQALFRAAVAHTPEAPHEVQMPGGPGGTRRR